jgi:hypothetical protein
VFAAAGIAAGGSEKEVINQRVKSWKFSYPTAQDRADHLAVQAAASFIQKNAASFPGGRVPDNPSQLAILALKVYSIFLDKDKTATNPQIANAIIKASREFDQNQASQA